MFPDSLDARFLTQLTPQQVRTYALAKGWIRVTNKNENIALFNHPLGKFNQLLVPTDVTLDDYAPRLSEVIERLAAFERRSFLDVLNDVLAVEADTLRFRVVSPLTGRGTIPLVEGIQLLEGAKQSLLAAACSVVNPVTHHPRMSRAEAQQLLNACHLGQTERRSYGISIACPLRAIEQDQQLLPGFEPFTRQTVALLMRSLDRVTHAIDADDVPNLFGRVDEQRVPLSANLCDAVLQMQPPHEGGSLSVRASWATNLPPATPLPSAVHVKHEHFAIIADIAKKLRPEHEPQAALYVGFVSSLSGEPNDEGDMQGEAVLSILLDEQTHFARLALEPLAWQIAHTAFAAHRLVRFRGILHRGIRSHRITAIREFAQME